MAGRKTDDGQKLLDRWYLEGNPRMQALLAEERKNAAIARKIHALREAAGFTQRELAQLAGTQASVICKLEDADYEGHSLSMLRRIAAALGHSVEVRFEPVKIARVRGRRRSKPIAAGSRSKRARSRAAVNGKKTSTRKPSRKRTAG